MSFLNMVIKEENTMKNILYSIFDKIDMFLGEALIDIFCWVYEIAFIGLVVYVFLGVILAPFVLI